MKDKIRIFYIAGYGHSGSTILEMLLGSVEGVTSLGELVNIGWMQNGSIRNRMKQADLCRSIYDQVEFHLQNSNASYSTFKEVSGCEHFLKKRNRKQVENYKKIWESYFFAVAEALDYPQPIFTDASKTSLVQAYRPALLQEIDGIEVSCIHIIRKPESILHRMKLKIKKGKLGKRKSIFFQMMISSMNWLFSNIWPTVYLSKKCTNYVRISFEELCEKPEAALQKIEKKTGISMENPVRYILNQEVLPQTCAFAGNRLRLQKQVRFNPPKSKRKNIGIETVFATMLHPFYKILT